MTYGEFQTAFRHVSDSLKTCQDKQTWAYKALSVCVCRSETPLGRKEKKKTLGGFTRPPKAEPYLLVLGSGPPPGRLWRRLVQGREGLMA